MLANLQPHSACITSWHALGWPARYWQRQWGSAAGSWGLLELAGRSVHDGGVLQSPELAWIELIWIYMSFTCSFLFRDYSILTLSSVKTLKMDAQSMPSILNMLLLVLQRCLECLSRDQGPWSHTSIGGCLSGGRILQKQSARSSCSLGSTKKFLPNAMSAVQHLCWELLECLTSHLHLAQQQ